MRRTASEVLNDLESRIARLERSATHWTDVYHPSEMVEGYIEDMSYEKGHPGYSKGSICDAIAREMSDRLKRKGYEIAYYFDWVGYSIRLPLKGVTYDQLAANPNLGRSLVRQVMKDAGLKGRIKQDKGGYFHVKTLAGGACRLGIYCNEEEGLSFDVARER